MVKTSSSRPRHTPPMVAKTLMEIATACLPFARLALAATVVLALDSRSTGVDGIRTDMARLVLPLPPEVPAPAIALAPAEAPLPAVDATTASLALAPAEAPRQAVDATTASLALVPAEAPRPADDAITTTASLGPLAPAPVPAEPPALDLPAALAQGAQAYASSGLATGDEIAKTLPNGNARTTAEWIALRTFPREAGYRRINAFLAAQPDWPSTEWLRKRAEEALFGDTHASATIRAAFADTPPRTPAGKLALARVKQEDNDANGATGLVRDVWRNDDFNKLIEKTVLGEFAALLTKADHKYRADRLLYKEETGSALRAAALAGPDVLALAKARAAVVNEAASDALIAAVPAALAKDPGLIFSQIQKLRRAQKFEAASAMMLAAPRDPALLVNGDEWWVERRMLARAMLDRGEGEIAWRLCAEHSAQGANAAVEAEFHAGWIALRFLDDPARARSHFTKLAQIAESPATAARAAYWLARTQEALGDNEGAAAFFASAAKHPTFFYGQLARARLGLGDMVLRPMPVAVTDDERAPATQVAEILLALGRRDIAAPLVYDSARNLEGEGQLAALAQTVARAHDAPLSLQLGKTAARRGIALDELAFPDFGVPDFVPLAGSADKALVYAIVRQESAFLARASSGAGAKGLMQLMVGTARLTAKKAGVGFDAARLTSDPAFNTQLGAAHLGTLFEEHDGSYVLTFAAYNAGGGRVKEWLAAYGDPRRAGVDVVDWIELIPITETRQYVQHILENLQVYRARMGQLSSSLTNDDLHAHGGRF